ncbi:MAG: NUDIX hydrolase, partial [Pseudomonadota bacterium]|nr:NUDIX hydrolase [Pseudomonadota bacterium]
MSSAPPSSTPRLAATILLLRDGAEALEVFMVVRHHEIDFAAGALVFPGGKLAPGDEDPRVQLRCTGIAGLAPEQIALRVAAIREAFEECGILLARARGAQRLLGPTRLAELGPRYRKALDKGDLGIADMLEAEDLELACEELVPFAHWITPTFMPKRFDTHFYLAVAPAEQLAVHDGSELVDSLWLRPAHALSQAAAGVHTLVPATELNVKKLGFSDSVDAALDAART